MAVGKPFEKGNPGKQKGTISKKTIVLNTFAQAAIEGGIDKFNAELMKLDGKDYCDRFMALLEYVKPKLQRTTIEGDGDNPLVIKVNIGK